MLHSAAIFSPTLPMNLRLDTVIIRSKILEKIMVVLYRITLI